MRVEVGTSWVVLAVKESGPGLIRSWRFQSLRKLAPREAVQAWLNGEFGIDDEPALIEALRRDPRVIGSDDQIIDTFCNAMVEGWDAQRTFERLTHSV